MSPLEDVEECYRIDMAVTLINSKQLWLHAHCTGFVVVQSWWRVS